MRGELTVEIALSPVEKAREGVIKSSSKESELFELLRKTRYELARTEGVPPYRIFNDKTLHDMVLLRPTDHTTMLAVNGVGERKLDLYGDIFLRCIRSFEE
jgi:ATP-dependent DNA helicase RecQ